MAINGDHGEDALSFLIGIQYKGDGRRFLLCHLSQTDTRELEVY